MFDILNVINNNILKVIYPCITRYTITDLLKETHVIIIQFPLFLTMFVIKTLTEINFCGSTVPYEPLKQITATNNENSSCKI